MYIYKHTYGRILSYTYIYIYMYMGAYMDIENHTYICMKNYKI